MVDTGELESFLNDKTCKDGDIVEIMNEGELSEKEDMINKRKYKVLNILVKLNESRELIFSPNKDAIKVFQIERGIDTSKWVGLKFKVKIYPKTSFGITRNAILPIILKNTDL